MSIPQDYEARVYAGVLGKIIGVYLGRPFEGWTYDRIMRELGEVDDYVHEKLNKPLIVTDDDITGTFTFLRALPDYGYDRHLTPAQIGRTWLNYLIEERTILWWGGLGNSTEHTAYLRLKRGIEAPRSGSIAANSKVVAEQIGAQIFIDGWAMVAPGDPELAVDLARRAASVSHDGEAIYGAQVVAALESQAFVESDLDVLLDTAVSFIPKDAVIYRMIGDLRDWRAQEEDWRVARESLAARYGYDTYGGNCHIVPNHGLVILSLLYGDDDFQKTLMIVNTCGWDTDCNSGNVGCIMGIKNGLAGIDKGISSGAGPDWRGPVADRLYLPSADGGRAITDAVTEAYHIVNIGRALAGESPIAPKNGARFHFELPGAVQGFRHESSHIAKSTLSVENVEGHSQEGSRSLVLCYRHDMPEVITRVRTATFIPPEAADMPGYGLIASPTLYPGQTLRARVSADDENADDVRCQLYVRVYGEGNVPVEVDGPEAVLVPGGDHTFAWCIPDTGGLPIVEVGFALRSSQRAEGRVYVDYVTWDGTPDVSLTDAEGTMWRRAWVNAVDQYQGWRGEPYRLVHNEGVGLLIQGTREWRDYRVTADVTPHMVQAAGLAARVQGMRRYYALLLCREKGDAPRTLRVVKALDGITVLGEAVLPWDFDETYVLSLEVVGAHIRAWLNETLQFEVEDVDCPLMDGAVALVCEEGRTATHAVRVQPVA